MERNEQNYLRVAAANINDVKKKRARLLQLKEMKEEKSFELEESKIGGLNVDEVVKELDLLKKHLDDARRQLKSAVRNTNKSIKAAHENIETEIIKDQLWKLTTNYNFMDSWHFLRPSLHSNESNDASEEQVEISQPPHAAYSRRSEIPTRAGAIVNPPPPKLTTDFDLAGSWNFLKSVAISVDSDDASEDQAGPSQPRQAAPTRRSGIPKPISRIPTRAGVVANPMLQAPLKTKPKHLMVPTAIRRAIPQRVATKAPSRQMKPVSSRAGIAPQTRRAAQLPSGLPNTRRARPKQVMRVPSKSSGLHLNAPAQAIQQGRSRLRQPVKSTPRSAIPLISARPQSDTPRPTSRPQPDTPRPQSAKPQPKYRTQSGSPGPQVPSQLASSRAASPSQPSSSRRQPGSNRAGGPAKLHRAASPSVSRSRSRAPPAAGKIAMSVDSELAPTPAPKPKPVRKASQPLKASTPLRPAQPTIFPYNYMPGLAIPRDVIERDILYVSCQLSGRDQDDQPIDNKLVQNMLTIARNFKMSMITKTTALNTIGALFWRLECAPIDFLRTFVYHPTNDFFEAIQFEDPGMNNVIRSEILFSRHMRPCELDKSYGTRQTAASINAVSNFLSYFEGSVDELAQHLHTLKEKKFVSRFTLEALMGDVTIGGRERSNNGVDVLAIPMSINGELSQGIMTDTERLNYLRNGGTIPRTDVASAAIREEIAKLEERLRKQGAEGQAHLDKSNVFGRGLKHVLQATEVNRQNLWQARGNDVPRWFPGCYTVFQDSFNLKPILTTSPSSMFLHAWRSMAPMAEAN